MSTRGPGRSCGSTAALLVGALLASPAPAEISGLVLEQGTLAPLEGVLVTVQETETRTTTGADGRFTLPVDPAPGLRVVGARKGYYNGSAAVSAAGGADILLEPVPRDDDPTYRFADPRACGDCHPNQWFQWQTSPMAQAGLNRWVHDTYSGTGTRGGTGGFVYLRDSVHAATNPYSECAACHQPETWIANPFTALDNTLDAPPPAVAHGVSCDVCHKIADIDETRPSFPGIFPGVVTLIRPAAPGFRPLQYGLRADVDYVDPAAMRASYQPQLAAAVCAACHQDKNDPDQDGDFEEPDGIVSEPTYLEWLESPYGDPASPRYATCVACHMPPFGATRVCSDPSVRLTRHPDSIRSHAIRGTSAEYLENAVDRLVVQLRAGRENVACPHWPVSAVGGSRPRKPARGSVVGSTG
jgi:hypothetical protein